MQRLSGPHTAFTLPHPRDIIGRDFRDAGDPEQREIVGEEAAQFHGFARD
jgi:hypothetical protein